MWEKREAEWAREQSARDRLMSEVIPAARGLDGHWSMGMWVTLTKSSLVILSSI